MDQDAFTGDCKKANILPSQLNKLAHLRDIQAISNGRDSPFLTTLMVSYSTGFVHVYISIK